MQLSIQSINNSALETYLCQFNFGYQTKQTILKLINQGLDVSAVIDAANRYTDPVMDKPSSTYSNDHMTAYDRLHNLVTA